MDGIRNSYEFRYDSRSRRAMSLIEVVASTMIVGLMSVAALNSLGAATKSSESIGNRAVALGLCDDLMSEILRTDYSDPNQTPTFGRESGESANGPRSTYDDVDDFHGWDKTPPQYRDGMTIPDRADWRQRVQVSYVQPLNALQTSASDTGAKRIYVFIEKDGEILAQQYAIRTDVD